MIKKIHSKTKVLFRLRSMETGGVQKVLTDFMTHLPQDQFEVSLLLNLNQGEMRNLIPKDIPVYSIGKGKENFSTFPPLRILQLVLRRIQLYKYKKWPKTLKNKLKFVPDIEVAFTSTEYSDVLNSPFENSKKVAWFHADIRDATLTDQGNKNVIHQLQQMDEAVFVSQQTLNIIKEVYDEEIPNGRVIYNPFHYQDIIQKSKEFEYSYPTQLPVFLSIGRFIDRKGFHTLVEAHAHVIQQGHLHEIHVLGTGPNLEKLKTQIEELGVQDTFILRGTVPNPYPYFVAADYFILPSKTEAYPLVIGEALVLEKAIISTKAGGVTEMMEDGVNGLLIDYNKEQMAKAMIQFLTNPEMVKTMEGNQKAALAKFDNEKIYTQVQKVLTKV